MKNNSIVLSLAVALAVLVVPAVTRASATSGTIDSSNRYGWAENVGWIDFGSTAGTVTVSDSELTGYAYSENVGWISLNCSNTSSCGTVDYKVSNTSSGVLSGYAWAENVGWVDFSGVTIGTDGAFAGYAYSENVGWISLNCSNTSSCGTVDYKVSTDWRPASARQSTTVVTTSSGKGTSSARKASNIARMVQPSSAPSVQTPVTLPSVTAAPATALILSECPDMQVGSTGECARVLQSFLNSHGFPVALSGAGSPGFEIPRFGPATRTALVAFQKTKGINPQSGYFGPKTKAIVKVMGF